MSESDERRKLELEWLRLTADCMQLAAEAHSPVLRRHFVLMAKEWSAQSERSPSPEAKTEPLG